MSLAAVLADLREENPEKLVSLVRLVWPDIRAALERGHSVKVIHERLVKGGVDISYRLFALYVGQLRREDAQWNSAIREKTSKGDAGSSPDAENGIAVIRVPKRRLFSAKAAAQYLGIHEQTLRRITERGGLPVSRLGTRLVFKLEDLDAYIESLPSCITASRF